MGKNNNTKIYQLLSYVSFLWILGIFTSKKDDTTLKIHVGQGMIIFFIELIVLILNNFIINNIFTTKAGIPNFYYTTVSPLGYIIIVILYLLPIFLSILGILKVIKNQDPKIPLIYKMTLYK